VPELKGFAPPYTESGRSALIPNPPWFYSGDLLTVEYRTDVEKRARAPPRRRRARRPRTPVPSP
jgi:acetoacetate decarboxylase